MYYILKYINNVLQQIILYYIIQYILYPNKKKDMKLNITTPQVLKIKKISCFIKKRI